MICLVCFAVPESDLSHGSAVLLDLRVRDRNRGAAVREKGYTKY